MPSSGVNKIISEVGLTHGVLPVRYLGVPLCTKKLSLSNCDPLIQQVKKKVNSWSARSLSFAGRLLLINTVISGISNFWCSTLTIPKKCIKLINSICGAYLWKGTTEGHHSARVSWETVTLAKNEGGLGIRDLLQWNVACNIKLVWLLFFRAGSIWVAWITKSILQDNKSNFWTIKEKQSHSYAIKKLLRVRQQTYNFIKVKVGDGRSTRFWTDNWSPFGNLREYLNASTTTALGIRHDAILSTIYRNGNWQLPSPRSEPQLNLQVYLTTIALTLEEDKFVWAPDGKELSTYSTGQVYNLIKTHQPVVPWAACVWSPRGIPKHNFLTWLVVLNRCPTKDRILGWGLTTSPLCLLCNSANESRDHLYFTCSFSASIWGSLAMRARSTPITSWPQVINHMQQLTGPKHLRILALLAWQSAIYFIWMERNSRLHRQQFRSSDLIVSAATSLIKNRISSLRLSSPSLSSKMMQVWLSP